METLRSLWQDHSYVIGGALALPVTYVLYRHLTKNRARKLKRADCPPNTVLLYQLSRGPYVPSLSPFPVKLELYLKINKIPYMNDLTSRFSEKGKTPWMSYNQEDVMDSQFCIAYLNQKLNINMNKVLNPEERAIAKALQVMIDEHLLWTLLYFRWVLDKDLTIAKLGFPNKSWCWFLMFRRRLANQMHGQGIGRHSPEETKHIMLADLQALSDFLGKKPFLMGQSVTEVDCSAFGMLSQFVWHAKDKVCENLIQERFPHLVSYCERIRDKFWPDWDECITHGGTKKATK